VAAAGEPALTAAAALHLDSQLISTTRSNVAEAWLHAGDLERAARTIGHTTDGPFRHEDWALHLLRAEVEIAQGRLDDALARVDLVGSHRFGAHAQREYLAQVRTEVLVWSGRSAEAWECVRPVLRTWVDTGEQALAAPMYVLAARAAAETDCATDGRARAVDELRSLRAEMPGEVFTTDRMGAAQQATYDAELAGAEGGPSAGPWVAAARRWDAVHRPHQSAYCRWRAARAAVAGGQGVAATRLLDRALRDAHEHVPLTEAIRATRVAQ
jgi:hypothetical protein